MYEMELLLKNSYWVQYMYNTVLNTDYITDEYTSYIPWENGHDFNKSPYKGLSDAIKNNTFLIKGLATLT